jgi:alpha-L-arabinofuranosidase
MRIRNGHVAPYNLKFIEIGNENYNFNMSSNSDQSYEYPERYYKFYTAIKEKYPDIITIGNVEAWGTDNPTWRNEYPVEIVDEHYYRSHAWMKQNYKKYDNYPRDVKVYNGEYAANSGGYGQYGNLNSALGEAVYMLGQERNSDVCVMGSFAPIFTHESDPTWAYDMIHFNSCSNFVTPSYHVQKMMGHNVGYQNLLWTESGNNITASGSHQIGLATWDTQVSFDDVKVTANGETIISDDFSGNNGWTT